MNSHLNKSLIESNNRDPQTAKDGEVLSEQAHYDGTGLNQQENNELLNTDHHNLPVNSEETNALKSFIASNESAQTTSSNSMVNQFFTQEDLKSRDSKYKRWTPKMDQFLIRLLSDVAHSHSRGTSPSITKKNWAYITGQLRAANPETVYSTYTKYSCQQHLFNVNHHRYKIWYLLILHAKLHHKRPQDLLQRPNTTESLYLYRWNVEVGKFEVIDHTAHVIVSDERQIKALIYGEELSLPSLSAYNKATLIVNDFFLTSNLRYLTAYHNDVLPLLIKSDLRYGDDLPADIYSEVPRFNQNHEVEEIYFKPLTTAKGSKKRNHDTSSGYHDNDHQDSLSVYSRLDVEEDVVEADESVDPALKRTRVSLTGNLVGSDKSSLMSTNFENAIANAAIAAIDSPAVVETKQATPIYVKDRKWFMKLISLYDSGNLSDHEVLVVCEGIRDGKIPLFMLNILDHDFYINKTPDSFLVNDRVSNDYIAKKIQQFMIPLTYES